MKYKSSLFNISAIGFLCTSVAYSTPLIAQTTDENEEESQAYSLEEIIVTGRKREESLQEIPVSISVLGNDVLAEQNILTQGDLAELVPGLNYNQGNGNINDRTAALPSIRGISSSQIATNRTKVSSFVDGMPILGSVGSINIGGATQVEVYSGPQSAAFGRSTFAGAINYVTSDPSEELEGNVGLNWSEDGTRIINGSLSGPLTDTLGFHVAGQYEDSVSPDSDIYSYSDGVESGTRGGTNLSARFVFEPTDAFKAKLTFSRDETDDGPNGSFYATQESTVACVDSLGTPFALVAAMGPPTLGVDGEFDCELDLDRNAGLQAVNDIGRYYDQNPAEFDALVQSLRDAGATDGEFGDYTVEEAARLIAEAYSVPFSEVGSKSERDRVTAQFDYLFESGSLLQLSLMNSEEEYIRQSTPIVGVVPPPIVYVEAQPETVGMGGVVIPATNATYNFAADERRLAGADPTEIEENYLELRWASPAEERLRYVVGAAYYDYKFLTDVWNSGYNAVLNGTADGLALLTADSRGGPDFRATLSEETTNTALFFNTSYDFTDTITGSFEGRYASDKVGATSSSTGQSDEVTTKSFVPRIGLNWTPNQDTTYYFQYAIGINPAGINADLLDIELTSTLDNGVPVDDTVYGGSINDNILTVNYDSGDYVAYDEEKLTNYEIGFKGSAFDNRLIYTGAVYHMKWEDAIQDISLDWSYPYATADEVLIGTEVPSVPGVYYVPEAETVTNVNLQGNSGTSETTGIELQANYQITDNWSISGNTSLMKAEYTDFCDASIYLSTDAGPVDDLGAYAGLPAGVNENGNACYVLDGNKLSRNPALTVSLTPSYRTEFDNGLSFNGTARINYSGKQYSDVENVQQIPAITTVNLTLGLSKDAWSGTFYIDNIFDDRTITNGGFFDAAVYEERYGAGTLDPSQYINIAGTNYSNISYNINEGRSFGMRLNYRF